MKLALCLVFCLGLALARVEDWSWLADDVETSRTIYDSEFQTGHEFHYFYNGQMTTGVPGSSKQHSGTRIQALVTFLFTSQNVCLMKLQNVRMGKMNRDLPTPRRLVKFEHFEELPIEEVLKEKLLLPIKFTYNLGLIQNVVFDGEEQPWSANIKRGIINMLQVNLQQQHQTVDVLDQVLPNMRDTTSRMRDTTDDVNVFYRVMEETIEGECETLYTITKPTKMSSTYGREVMNVTKSINFEKCKRRPEIKYNFRFSDPCPTCDPKYVESEKFLKASTVSQIGLTGTPSKFLIDNCRVESEYTFVPFNEESNVIMTYVHQNLKLVKTNPMTSRIEEPRQPIESDSDMIYTMDWDVAKETFHMEEDTTLLRRTMHPKIQNKPELIVRLLEKMISKMSESVEDVVPKYFSQLITLFRMCTRQEFDQIKEIILNTNRFNPEEMKKVRDILPHITATCGTKVCVELLVEKIRSQEIPTLRAISVMKDLINIRTPSKEIINELLKLAESDVCERHFMLKQSVWLTIGSLMNALCSNNVDKWAREMKESSERFCPTQLKEQYVQLLVNKLHSTTKWEERLTYLKTLGNAGLDLSVFELEKIIRNVDTQYSPLARSEAVLALRQLRDIMPKKIQKILMPILLNKLETPTVRIAACYMIMQTLPERPILDQIAKMVFHERSLQVASFVYSYMDTLANSTNPCEKKFVTDMRLALRHIKKIDTSALKYSKITRIPMHSVHHKIGLDLELASSFVDRTHIPRYLTATLHSNFLGFWNKYLVSFGLVTENMETLLQRLVGEHKYLFDDESMMGLFSHLPRDNVMDYDMKNIFSNLKSFTSDFEDTTSKHEPKGWFQMKFKDQDVGFLPLNKELIQSFLSEHNFNMFEIQNKLRQGLTVNMNKAKMLHEMVYKIPTTFGMPLTVTTKIPMVMSIHGKLQTVSNGLKNFEILANLKPSFALTLAVDVECWSPIVNHGLKVVNKIKVFKPVNAKIEVDLVTPLKNVRITIRPPTTRRDIVTLESKPITYTRVWPKMIESDDKVVMGEEMTRVHKINKCIGQRVFGVNFCLRGVVKKSPTHSIVGTPFFPLSGPNKVVLSVEPGHETPEEIVINLSGKFFQTTFNPMTTNLFDDMETTSDRYTNKRYNEYNTRRYENEFNTEHFESRYTPKKPISSLLKVDIIVGQSPRLSMELSHTCDMLGRYGKLHMKVVHVPVSREYNAEPIVLCLDSETMYPEHIESEQMLTNARLTWGHSCNSNNYITLKSKAQKLPARNIFETEIPEYNFRESYETRYPTSRNSELLKYVVDIDYNNVPFFVQNMTYKVLGHLKNKYYEHLDVSSFLVRNPENKVRCIVTVDPITKQYVNLVVKSPKQNTIINDIPLLFPVTPMTTKQSYFRKIVNILRGDFSSNAICQVSGNTLKTFDNVERQLPLSTSFKVLAQDCSEQQRCVVMMRKLTETTDLKEVKIITGSNKIVITPVSETDDQIKIFINGREYPITEDVEMTENLYELPSIKVYRQGSEIKVELLNCGVTISFNGLVCNIEKCLKSPVRLCGPCGKSMNVEHNVFDSMYKKDFNDEYCNDFECKYNKRRDNDYENTERTFFDEEETSPFWETLFQDNEFEVPTMRSRKQHQQKRSFFGQSRKPTFWGLDKEPRTDFWGLDKEPVSTLFDDIYENREQSLYNDDMEVPTMKSLEHRRSFLGQTRKPSTFWGLDKDQEHESTFWGLDKEQEHEDNFWGLMNKERKSNFWGQDDDFENVNEYETVYGENKRTVTPLLKHKVMEVENKVCISLERIPECPSDCRPVQKVEKRVIYTCLRRNDPEVNQLVSRIRYGESVGHIVERMTPSKTRTEVVPTKCTKMF
jgi:hypothetical protein